MVRPYYEDYVNHMLRHYCRYADRVDDILSDSDTEPSPDRVNVAVCCSVLSRLRDADRETIRKVYSSDGWYRDRVSLREIIREVGITEEKSTLRLIRDVTNKIRELRGL